MDSRGKLPRQELPELQQRLEQQLGPLVNVAYAVVELPRYCVGFNDMFPCRSDQLLGTGCFEFWTDLWAWETEEIRKHGAALSSRQCVLCS